MPNIQFNYMYRDGANYKNHSEVIFANPEKIKLREAEIIIKTKLISEEYFYVDQWGLKDLHFGTWDNEIDHTWHEFKSIQCTDEPANENCTFKQFLERITALPEPV